jgi:hypothetical protein
VKLKDLRGRRAPPPSPPHPALPSVAEIDGRPPWASPQPLRPVAVPSPPSPYPPTRPPPLPRGARRKGHGHSSVAGQSSDAAPSLHHRARLAELARRAMATPPSLGRASTRPPLLHHGARRRRRKVSGSPPSLLSRECERDEYSQRWETSG